MIIENTEECKMQIRKLGYKFTEFADEADIKYPNLIKALNGDFVALEVRYAFEKFGISYTKLQSRGGKKNTKRVA